MKTRALLARVSKLEAACAGRVRHPYVIRVSDPPTEAEQALMQANAVARKPLVLVPHKSRSIAEWMARCAGGLA